MAAWRVERFPENAAYILAWEGAWPLARARPTSWVSSNSVAGSRMPVGAATRAAAPTESSSSGGRAALGPALLPLSYDRPLHLVRGEGVWLIDADGERFLDAYNNVPVVGHCASARRRRGRETGSPAEHEHSRYLFDSVVELAERLLATMPAGHRHRDRS